MVPVSGATAQKFSMPRYPPCAGRVVDDEGGAVVVVVVVVVVDGAAVVDVED
jgi:hypothetical protein